MTTSPSLAARFAAAVALGVAALELGIATPSRA